MTTTCNSVLTVLDWALGLSDGRLGDGENGARQFLGRFLSMQTRPMLGDYNVKRRANICIKHAFMS